MRIETIELSQRVAGSSATLTAYLLDDLAKCEVTPRPAVIVCPGGSYTHLADREGEPVALAFAAEGCQAFVLRYTLGDPEGGNPAYPACFDELSQSVALLRERADEWEIDPNRVFVCGFSAGGHLVLMQGTAWRRQAERLGLEPELLRPSGVIAGYPLADVRGFGEFLFQMSGLYPDHPAVKMGTECANAVFGRVDPSADEMDALTPVTLANAESSPTFIWATAEDKLVDPSNALKMASALSAAHVPVELHLFERGPHGMSLASSVTAGPGGTRVDDDAAQWLDLAVRWIRRR